MLAYLHLPSRTNVRHFKVVQVDKNKSSSFLTLLKMFYEPQVRSNVFN